MSDETPQSSNPTPTDTPADNRPPEGEIPDILEWKLDVVMAQLEKIGGGAPSDHNPTVNSGTRVRLPNPDEFDLEKDPIPHNPGIPEILEFKLDLLIRGIGRLSPLANLLANGLAAIIALLIAILMSLAVIIGQLGAINAALAAITALLGAILFFILFVVIRVVVPFIRDSARP